MSDRPNDEPPAAGSVVRCTRFDVHVDRHRVANVRGELDASTAPRFAVELDRLADDGGVVCVDFSDLEFCGAAGINVLFGVVRRLGAKGRLVIYDPSPMVARVIDITGLEQLVDVTVSRSSSHRAWRAPTVPVMAHHTEPSERVRWRRSRVERWWPARAWHARPSMPDDDDAR